MRCVSIGKCSTNKTDGLPKFGDNVTMNCQDRCSDNSYGHPVLKICVK